MIATCNAISQQETTKMPQEISPALAEVHAALEAQAKETANWLVTQHRDGIIPPAEKIVLDALRALAAIPPTDRLYAAELMDSIAQGYLNTAREPLIIRRRIAALLRIAAEGNSQ